MWRPDTVHCVFTVLSCLFSCSLCEFVKYLYLRQQKKGRRCNSYHLVPIIMTSVVATQQHLTICYWCKLHCQLDWEDVLLVDWEDVLLVEYLPV